MSAQDQSRGSAEEDLQTGPPADQSENRDRDRVGDATNPGADTDAADDDAAEDEEEAEKGDQAEEEAANPLRLPLGQTEPRPGEWVAPSSSIPPD